MVSAGTDRARRRPARQKKTAAHEDWNGNPIRRTGLGEDKPTIADIAEADLRQVLSSGSLSRS